jgi:hypothetical protein
MEINLTPRFQTSPDEEYDSSLFIIKKNPQAITTVTRSPSSISLSPVEKIKRSSSIKQMAPLAHFKFQKFKPYPVSKLDIDKVSIVSKMPSNPIKYKLLPGFNMPSKVQTINDQKNFLHISGFKNKNSFMKAPNSEIVSLNYYNNYNKSIMRGSRVKLLPLKKSMTPDPF